MVVAIIAVLAAIVLVNVTQYIKKSQHSAVRADVAVAAQAAATWFEANGSMSGFCAGADVQKITHAVSSISSGYTARCGDYDSILNFCANPTTWYFSASYPGSTSTDTAPCVDSNGVKGGGPSTINGAPGGGCSLICAPNSSNGPW